jgi:hypothetical protein
MAPMAATTAPVSMKLAKKPHTHLQPKEKKNLDRQPFCKSPFHPLFKLKEEVKKETRKKRKTKRSLSRDHTSAHKKKEKKEGGV